MVMFPKPPALTPPPPPPDETAALFREMARQATERSLRASRGTARAFNRTAGLLGSLETYRAPGSKMTTGGV